VSLTLLYLKPEGRVFFACEVEEPVKMGMLQRAFVGAAMSFIKRMSNNSIAYSITGSEEENPHMAFSVEIGMPCIIVTKPGETLPTLGEDLVEDPERLKRRLKTGLVDWNTEDTYTMAMYTSYFDFLSWQSMNFPGIKPFDLSSVLGPQPIHLTLYVLPFGQDKHTRKSKEICANLEISNSNHTEIGSAAKQWIERNCQLPNATIRGASFSSGDNDSVDDDVDLEEQTIVELGGDNYLRSGDPVVLEASSIEPEAIGSLCDGGGFAIVQRNANATTIIVEKASSKKIEIERSSLIRYGDIVKIKLIVSGGDEITSFKYLSIHRGWWLKWVINEPKHNGLFTVLKCDSEIRVGESENLFVSIGGVFGLTHKRWDGFRVGVRAEESLIYGGRMLGLYDSFSRKGDFTLADMEPESIDRKWMKPIYFRPQWDNLTKPTTPKHERNGSNAFQDSQKPELPSDLRLNTSNCKLDVPVWIEMLDRTTRRRKLAYAVRVVVDYNENDTEGQKRRFSFCRLRSGKVLAEVIQAGLEEPKKLHTSKQFEEKKLLREDSFNNLNVDLYTEFVSTENNTVSQIVPHSPSRDGNSETEEGTNMLHSNEGQLITVVDNEDKYPLSDDEFDADLNEITPRKLYKGRKIMDQIVKTVNFDNFARTVATNTAKTGKQVKRVSVTAGKAIIAPVSRTATAIQHSKKPPTRDPKTPKVNAAVKSSKRKKESEFLAVNRTVKKIEKRNAATWMTDPCSLAGELSRSEQAMRITSQALNRISSAAPQSHAAKYFEDVAVDHFLESTELDRFFLQGGAVQVAVVPPEDQKCRFASLVARCLWESHWREEWLGVYKQKIKLFVPGSKLPSLQISFADISDVRSLDLSASSPLPGFPIAVIETAWQCYYFAFPDVPSKNEFCEHIQDQLKTSVKEQESENELWKARFWQGFQDSVDAAASTGNQKWAKINSGSKSMHRSVLNGRKMSFDITALVSMDEHDDIAIRKMESFVEKMLCRALETTFETMEKNPVSFSEFLDMASQLRSLPFDRIDLSQASALCLFTNIYHCLLQHALLLTINGPLYKKSVGHFFRTSCYEIGGDVFSLAELYHCVIRGNMSKPNSPKNPYLEIPRKSLSYCMYGLTFTEPRISFVLSTGDVSCPQEVAVLYSDNFDVLVQHISSRFIEKNVTIDETKRTLTLPKICDVYRNDFGILDSLSMAYYCISFLSQQQRARVEKFLNEDSPYIIRFANCAEQYHQFLSRWERNSILDERQGMKNFNYRPMIEVEDDETKSEENPCS
jgi:Protein of unknown function, DUF547/Protein of unknown function (DUF1769)